MEHRKLWIALLDPYNIYALDDIRFRAGIPHLVVTTCTETDYKRFIEEHLETRGIMDEIHQEGEFYTRAVCYLQTREQAEEEQQAAELTQELRLASSESPIIGVDPGDRAHRQRQDDHAACRTQFHQQPGDQHRVVWAARPACPPVSAGARRFTK